MQSRQYWLPVVMVAASFVGGGLVNVALSGKDPETLEVVRARKFVLVDEEDQPRGLWNVFADGSTGLALAGEDDKPGGVWAVLADGSSALNLFDKNGRVGAKLAVGTDGSTALTLADKDGKIIFRAP